MSRGYDDQGAWNSCPNFPDYPAQHSARALVAFALAFSRCSLSADHSLPIQNIKLVVGVLRPPLTAYRNNHSRSGSLCIDPFANERDSEQLRGALRDIVVSLTGHASTLRHLYMYQGRVCAHWPSATLLLLQLASIWVRRVFGETLTSLNYTGRTR